jgi:hypothetical protein
MRSFLIVTAILYSLILTAKAQDTVKAQDPAAHLRLLRHRLKRDILTHPSLVTKNEILEEDSVRRSLLLPEKHHPVLYVDGGFGYTFAGLRGIEGSYSLNYGYKHNLFTFRGLGTASYEDNPKDIFRLFPDQPTGSMSQYALLYGWRITGLPGHAFSLSAGISADSRRLYSYDNTNQQTHTVENYAGLPFEANYQWFTRRFGVSFGIKLTGDISKHDFIGIGVDMGLGFHNSH